MPGLHRSSSAQGTRLGMTSRISDMAAAELYLFLFRFQFGDFLFGMLLELSLELHVVAITR